MTTDRGDEAALRDRSEPGPGGGTPTGPADPWTDGNAGAGAAPPAPSIRPTTTEAGTAGAAGPTAVLVAGLGLGAALLAWALWDRVGWARPPGAVVALALWAAVASRCLGSLGETVRDDRGRGAGDEQGAEHGAAYVGLVLGWALVAGLARWHPAASATAAVVGCLLVWTAWVQTGRIARDLAAPRRDAGSAERLRREDLPASAAGDGPEATPGARARGAVAGWWAVSGLLALLVPVARGGRAHPLLALAGVGLEGVCGGLLVAWGVRAALVRRAAADGARVLPEFSLHAASALAAVLLAALAALALPAFPPLDVRGLGGSLVRAFVTGGHPGPGGQSRPAATAPNPAAPPAAAAGAGRLGVYLAGAAGLALLAVLLVLAVRRLLLAWRGASRPRGSGSVWWFLGQFLRALWAALASLWSGLGPLWSGIGTPWRRPGGGRGAAPPGARGSRGTARNWGALGDPRARVRAAYRAMLAGAADRGHRRPRGASPRGFARQIEPALPPASGEHRRLTTLYEEARYSPHPVTRGDAADAAQASRSVVERLGPP